LKRFALPLVILLLVGLAFVFWADSRAPHRKPEPRGNSPELVERVKKQDDLCKKVRQQYPKLYNEVSAVMFKIDPIGINYQTNTDEYDFEAGAVIARLKDCATADDVATVLQEVFTESFDAQMAGDRSRYAGMAREIWALWAKEGSRP
jgi:hypothetical protein